MEIIVVCKGEVLVSKNILIISSSMSGTRNTKKLCEQFEKGAIESLNNVELLELKGKKNRL